MRWLLLLLALALAGGAQNKELPVDKPIDPATLKVEDARWRTARAFMQKQAQAWFHQPCHIAGNFIQESWTRGPGSNHGLVPRLQESPGTGWYRWGVLHYNLPDAFGLQLSAGHNPNPDGWGVSCWYSRGGKSVLGDGCAVTFTRWNEGKAVEKLTLAEYHYDFGSDYPVTGEAVTLKVGSDGELAALWKDPASLQKTALLRLDELEKRAEATLTEHRVQHRTYGKYEGDGIPPPTFLNQLTPAQEADLQRKLRQELERRRELIQAHAPEFHTLLKQLLPKELWGDYNPTIQTR